MDRKEFLVAMSRKATGTQVLVIKTDEPIEWCSEIITTLSQVSAQRLRAGTLTTAEEERVKEAVRFLSSLPIMLKTPVDYRP